MLKPFKLEKLVLASNNVAKLQEMRALLQPISIELIPQSEFGIPEAAETGESFIENAIIKARNAAKYTDLPALADDSGIEVDALRGAPGIRSARYAGTHATDIQNNEKLLTELAHIPPNLRNARYQCVIAFMRYGTDPMPIVCTGTWGGEVLQKPRGTNGFGYDPLFYVPTHQCSAAELVPEVKNQLSHRALALKHLVSSLKELKALR